MVVTFKVDGKMVALTAIYFSIGIAALLLAFPEMSVWVPKNSSEMASWVQAIGAIVAIAAGFFIAQFQIYENRKDELKKQQELEIENIVSHSFLLIDGYERVSLWASESELLLKRGNINWSFLTDGCDKVRAAIDLLDPYRTPSLKDVARLTYVKRHLDDLKWSLDQVNRLRSQHQTINSNSVKRITEEYTELIDVVEKYKTYIFSFARSLANEDQANDLEELRVMHAALRGKSAQRAGVTGIESQDFPTPKIGHA